MSEATKIHSSEARPAEDKRAAAAVNKGAKSRAKMVSTTASLLQKQGYNGTGLNQIIKESSTPKGSIYFHFPGGKEELAAAAIRSSGEEFGDRLRAAIGPHPDLGEAIDATCRTLAAELLDSDYHDGCPVATVTLEAASQSEPIRLACEEQYRTWQDFVRDTLLERGLDEELAAELGVLVLASVEGAMILCRAYRSTEPLEAVGRNLKRLISTLPLTE